jgi:hypothetical protein
VQAPGPHGTLPSDELAIPLQRTCPLLMSSQSPEATEDGGLTARLNLTYLDTLKLLLRSLSDPRHADEDRFVLLLTALTAAKQAGLECGLRLGRLGGEEWGVVAIINLPTGQVAYPIPQMPPTWAGNDAEQRALSLRRFLAS